MIQIFPMSLELMNGGKKEICDLSKSCRKYLTKSSAMKIEIIKINNSNIVTFSSEMGYGKGVWIGDEQAIVNKKYNIEIDIDIIPKMETNTFRNSCEEKSIVFSDSKLSLKGFIESVDDDGILYFRLSDDCLIMLESDGTFSKNDLIEIKLDYHKLSLSPF